MNKANSLIKYLLVLITVILFGISGGNIKAQQKEPIAEQINKVNPKRITQPIDSIAPPSNAVLNNIATDSIAIKDSIATENRRKLSELNERTKAHTPKVNKPIIQQWRPNSTKATWYAIIFPGGGQIYNRKYWKLPILYGGFAGCAYALNWNNTMYKDYAQAYRDLKDNNPNSNSYLELLPPNATIDKARLETLLKNRKDRFRRYRDLSIIAFIGVYALSIIDAYVDAELSNFDISPDLSLRIEPTIIKPEKRINNNLKNNNVGLLCRVTF